MLNTIDPSTPPNNEPAGLGAGEFRDLKNALATQFPTIPGDDWDIPLAVGPRSLNAVSSKVDSDDFDELEARTSVNELALVNQAMAITALGVRVTALEGAGYTTLAAAVAASIAAAWPIGSLFISYDGGTPNSKGITGTWAQIGVGSVLLGASSSFGGTGGSMSLTISEANLPAHRHLVSNNTTGAASPLLSSNQVQKGDPGSYNLSGSAADATIGRSSEVGSGSAADITPAHVKVAFYRRTA